MTRLSVRKWVVGIMADWRAHASPECISLKNLWKHSVSQIQHLQAPLAPWLPPGWSSNHSKSQELGVLKVWGTWHKVALCICFCWGRPLKKGWHLLLLLSLSHKETKLSSLGGREAHTFRITTIYSMKEQLASLHYCFYDSRKGMNFAPSEWPWLLTKRHTVSGPSRVRGRR